MLRRCQRVLKRLARALAAVGADARMQNLDGLLHLTGRQPRVHAHVHVGLQLRFDHLAPATQRAYLSLGASVSRTLAALDNPFVTH